MEKENANIGKDSIQEEKNCLGSQGQGMTFFSKLLIIKDFYRDKETIVLDPKNECNDIHRMRL